MIAECGVDPEVMATWAHFQSLQEDFGVGKGRLICEYPGAWQSKVFKRAQELVATNQNTDVQVKRMTEIMLGERFGRKLVRSARSYDGNSRWLINALDARPPFDLIVARNAPERENCVDASDLLKNEPPFFRRCQVEVRRTPEDLVEAAATLLSRCKQLRIVEPNFRAEETRFSSTLIHLFEQLERWKVDLPKIELHTQRLRNHKELYKRHVREHQLRENIQPHLPPNTELRVFHWDRLPNGNKPHPRFILTEIGGLYYDHGLDSSDEDPKTMVTLLEDEIWKKLTDELAEPPHNFDRDEYLITVRN